MNMQTTELIIVAAIAFVMLLQAIMMVALFVVVRKTITKLHAEMNETRSAVMVVIEKVQPVIEKMPPIVESIRTLITNSTPKIESAISDIAIVTQKLRAETNDVQVAASEIVQRVRRQGARIDSMTTKTLDAVDRAAGFVTDTLGKPIRQLGAVLASARAVMETLRAPVHDGHGHADQVHDPDYYA